jgi:hypothetical protein
MAGPISRLTGAQSRLEANMEDLKRPFDKLAIDAQAVRTELAAGIVAIVDAIEPISEIIEWWYGEEKRNGAASTIAEALARDSEARTVQRKL